MHSHGEKKKKRLMLWRPNQTPFHRSRKDSFFAQTFQNGNGSSGRRPFFHSEEELAAKNEKIEGLDSRKGGKMLSITKNRIFQDGFPFSTKEEKE